MWITTEPHNVQTLDFLVIYWLNLKYMTILYDFLFDWVNENTCYGNELLKNLYHFKTLSSLIVISHKTFKIMHKIIHIKNKLRKWP